MMCLFDQSKGLESRTLATLRVPKLLSGEVSPNSSVTTLRCFMPQTPTIYTLTIPSTPLTNEEIESVFSLLGLTSEEDRDAFRALSQSPQATDQEPTKCWLTGTTDMHQDNEGVSHA